MRILFIGMPDMALTVFNFLIKSKKNIVAVVPPVSGHPTHNLMVMVAKKQHIPCIYFNNSPKEVQFIEAVKSIKPDIAVVCSFDYLLPPELLSIPKFGVINCHPSLLPEYRGGNPYFHVINNGEKYTGVTLHFMDESFDTGDIISQYETPLAPDETMGTLFNRLNYKTAEMLDDVLTLIESGKNIESYKQDKNKFYKKAPKILPDKGHNKINWSDDSEAIDRFVRACNPFLGATCYFRGDFVRIWSGKYSKSINMSNVLHGSIIKITADNILISTANGIYMPETIQYGSYFVGGIKEFIKRVSPKVGESLY